MGSTRLPGKSLAMLRSAPVLDWVVQRAGGATHVDEVIVATSIEPGDDAIAEWCAGHHVTCVRGHPTDVLERYADALTATEADLIVRITADCPFVDPGVIDAAIERLEVGRNGGALRLDYVSTSLDGRYPRGLDVEVVRRDVLMSAEAEATEADEREHVTLFVYRRQHRFACAAVEAPLWARRPDLRFTVDESEDLELVRSVADGLMADPGSVTAAQIIQFLDERPDVADINRNVSHRTVT
jgi:spore coat polysaccharide biosynthesis protein SpsF (cytidylyltransferase family)